MDQKFVLGVNYWPRCKAMYWWSQFDAGEVREEFDLIKELGLSVVRIFLLWDDFQPEPTSVDKNALNNLVQVADIASQRGLGLDVTFFTGHMSGPNWAPRWLMTDQPGFSSPYFAWVRQVVTRGKVVPNGNYRNMFTDPVALDAERLLLRTVVGVLKDHPGIWMWNLGNEPDLFAWPANADAGQAWAREMISLIKTIDPLHPVTVGTHGDSLGRDNGFRIDKVHLETDIPVMHSYPMYCEWARGPLDPDYVPFTTALTAALAGKPALMEEFGGCTNLPGKPSETWEWISYDNPRKQYMASEEDFAEYMRLVMPRVQEIGSTGAFVWCFADYAPELWNRPPCGESLHERHFGLVRPDGSIKPHAEAIRRFAETNPLVKPIPAFARFPGLVGQEYYSADLSELQPALYRDYLAKKEQA
jgi:endo-1,4-beta-mannosidase